MKEQQGSYLNNLQIVDIFVLFNIWQENLDLLSQMPAII